MKKREKKNPEPLEKVKRAYFSMHWNDAERLLNLLQVLVPARQGKLLFLGFRIEDAYHDGKDLGGYIHSPETWE
jgi:hypothetical protein